MTEQQEQSAAHKELLRRYEPVLRFSSGENFFPTRVDSFIKRSRLLRTRKNWTDQTVWKFEDNLSEEQVRERLEKIGDFGPDHYLQFVPFRSWPAITSLVLLLLFHVAVIGIAMQPENFGNFGPQVSGFSNSLKVWVLGALIVLWPLFQANRKVHFAILLNLFGITFFGTLEGLGFGVLALALLLGMVVLFLFKGTLISAASSRHADHDDQESTQQRILRGINTFFGPLVTLFTGGGTYLLIRLLTDLGLVSRVPIEIVTRFGTTRITPLTGGTFAILAGLFLGSVWFWRAGKFNLAAQRLQIRILFFSALLISGTFLVGRWLGLPEDPSGRAVLSLLLMLEAVAAGFWLFAHPIQLESNTPFLDPNNRRQKKLGLNGTVLFFVIFGIFFWTWGTMLIYLSDVQGLEIPLITADFIYRLFGGLPAVFFNPLNAFFIFLLDLFMTPWVVFLVTLAISILILGSDIGRYLLDMRSGQLDSAADAACERYQALLLEAEAQGKPAYTYYGRVREPAGWVVLQYFYFYAYNDWRSNAGGLNHHEGDWEAVSIYLRRNSGQAGDYSAKHLKPIGVAFSQHHEGVFCFWDSPSGKTAFGANDRVVVRVNGQGADANHPVVYAALGSHANYHYPGLYPNSSHFQGFARDILLAAERLLARFKSPSGVLETYEINQAIEKRVGKLYTQVRERIQKTQQQAYDYVQEKIAKGAVGYAFNEIVGTPVFQPEQPQVQACEEVDVAAWKDRVTGDPPVGLPPDIASGDGLRIGPYQTSMDLRNEFLWPARLPSHIYEHASCPDGRPRSVVTGGNTWQDLAWECLLVDGEPWVEFQGLWGRNSSYKDEAGPPGPKWDRMPAADNPDGSGTPRIGDEQNTLKTRLRWGEADGGLDWMYTLLFEMIHNESISLEARRQALEILSHHVDPVPPPDRSAPMG
jgi:hypothetical protein